MAERPGTGDVRVDTLLTNLSVLIHNETYISRMFFPVVPVEFQSDIIPTYEKSHWHRLRAKELTEREAPPVGGYATDNTNTYFCREYGFAHFISDRRRANTANPYDADRDGVRFVVDAIELQHEYNFVDSFWKAGVWGLDEAGTTDFVKWSTLATSTPILDKRRWKRTIRRALSGSNPNVLGLGDLTFDILVDHPDYLDRIKYGQISGSPAIVTENLVAQVLGLEEVHVGVSMYTTSPEGTAEASVTYTPLWDDDALMIYRNPRPSQYNKSAGYNFAWRSVYGTPRYIRRRRDPISDKGDLVELFEWYDMKLVVADAGAFGVDCVD